MDSQTELTKPDVSVASADSLPAWAWPDRLHGLGAHELAAVDRVALARFGAAAIRSAGARPSDARLTADTLVIADVRGHPSHGVSRLRQYLRLIDDGGIDPRARHEVLHRRLALESWDARHALGPAVGHRAMDRAIRQARRAGLAAVIVRDTGHYGIAGAYVLRAMEAGVIGISSCNTDLRVPPTGARAAGLGTNPIAIGAPDGQGKGFLLDMATSVVAGGKVEIAQRAGRSIPEGWALDVEGRPTTDPVAALPGMMLPLGGQAETSGYKGYGLAASVEMLTGILGGGAFGRSVSGLWDSGRPTTISQLHIAIDPAAVGDADEFEARLRAWRTELTTLPRQPGVDEIFLPGDPEWRATAAQEERIEMLTSTVQDLAHTAVERGLHRAWKAVLA
jgi:LDH2 family malate/lactate/ureidoglycolate dehydrogenase